MEIQYTTYRINLKHSFGISRSSHDYYDIVYFYIIDGKIIGRGEAAPSKRYNESADAIISILTKGLSLPKYPYNKDTLWSHLKPQLNGIHSLEAAVNMALWDWWAQKSNKPVYDILKIDISNLPNTSYTIAIGDMKDLEEKIELSSPYNILKVKLGTPNNDKEIIRQIRQITDKVIRVDANEGWDFDMAKDMCFWLSERNVEFIEQPFPENKLNDTAKLREISPLPLFSDENSISSKDIMNLKDVFDGINIKLMKCGGIDEAINMINLAKDMGMKIMLGCMVESSVAITAAAQLAGKVDAIDLDGNLLINNDPYIGVKIVDGCIDLLNNNSSGMGLSLNSSLKGLI